MSLCVILAVTLAACGVYSLSTEVASRRPRSVQGPTSASGRRRSWVQVPRSPDASEEKRRKEVARVRVLSYNVLGPKQALTSKHNYCPQSLRKWRGRSKRLEDEIRKYHGSAEDGLHAVCLQEVTPKTLQETWVPFMKKIGLDGHVYQPKGLAGRFASHNCLGVAIFFSNTYFEMTMGAHVFFPREVEHLREGENPQVAVEPVQPLEGEDLGNDETRGGASTAAASAVETGTFSRLETDLGMLKDGAVILRLRIRGLKTGSSGENDGQASERQPSVTLACCHLWYNPLRPDLKTAQCGMLFDAIKRFHESCGCAAALPRESARDGGGGNVGDSASSFRPAVEGRNTGEASNLIVCGDFNAVPMLQPEFLPGPLKAAAEEACSASDQERREGSAEMLPPGFASFRTAQYPSQLASSSGVYALLKYGRVPPEHPEHPDTFIPELMANESALRVRYPGRQKTAGKFGASPSLRYRAGPGLSHRPVGEWKTGYGSMLEDVYGNLGDAVPLLTTRTGDFTGIIDHIFVSSGERGGPTVQSFLRLPLGADVGSARSAGAGAGAGAAAGLPGMARGSGRERIDFGPIPDVDFGSDHLALGVELSLY